MVAFAWNFFKQLPGTRDAECFCGAIRKCLDNNGSKTTGGMKRHLEKDHAITPANYQSKCIVFYFFVYLYFKFFSGRPKYFHFVFCQTKEIEKSNFG